MGGCTGNCWHFCSYSGGSCRHTTLVKSMGGKKPHKPNGYSWASNISESRPNLSPQFYPHNRSWGFNNVFGAKESERRRGNESPAHRGIFEVEPSTNILLFFSTDYTDIKCLIAEGFVVNAGVSKSQETSAISGSATNL